MSFYTRITCLVGTLYCITLSIELWTLLADWDIIDNR